MENQPFSWVQYFKFTQHSWKSYPSPKKEVFDAKEVGQKKIGKFCVCASKREGRPIRRLKSEKEKKKKSNLFDPASDKTRQTREGSPSPEIQKQSYKEEKETFTEVTKAIWHGKEKKGRGLN